ncbi:MAG TPA: hypothetical protein VEU07_03750, partial [Candidatus Acidoferrum sp.]|nr:hypothetical protein [Candidatus Acidoferrum sp.]
TKAGAIAGMLAGLLTMILFVEMYRAPGGPAIPIAGALAMIVPVLVVPLVSLCTRPPAAATLAKAFGTAAEVAGEKNHDLG